MSASSPLSADLLLQHESFVRAVVRGVLSDEDSVQDVVQETWLRALKRPPRSGTPVRAWLGRVAGNLARDKQRSRANRSAREERVAREERLESVASVHERLSAQQAVVQCVLRLDEPYRSVVLLRYYEDQSAEQIGERLGRSAATVRSQLSRAHRALRGSLDRSFEGDRKAWAALLAVPLARMGLVGPAAGLVVAGALAVVMWPSEPTKPSVIEPVATVGNRESEPEASALVVRDTATREGVEPVAEKAEPKAEERSAPVSQDDLEGRSVQELVELAVQVQREIERQVFEPAQHHLDAYAHYEGREDAGVDRILHGEGPAKEVARGLMVRSGGQFFSFPSRTHDYNHAPDLCFRGGAFSSGFAGIDLGLMMELGSVRLDDLQTGVFPIPVQLSEEAVEDWETLWSELTLEDLQHGAEFREQLPRRLRKRLVGAPLGTTFLVRSCQPSEHDILAAFRPLSYDEDGCTFAWRILSEWRALDPSAKPHRTKRYEDVPTGPASLGALDVSALLELLDRVRARGQDLLMTVPPGERDPLVSRVEGDARAGFGRILERFRFQPLFGERGGGSYYSFLTRSNSFDARPDLRLEQGYIHAARGFVLEAGPLSDADLDLLRSGQIPTSLDERTAEAVDFLTNVRAVPTDSWPELSEEDEERTRRLKLHHGTRPTVGHTYVFRGALDPDHDHLVVFTVIGGDENGYAFAWWIVRTYAPVR